MSWEELIMKYLIMNQSFYKSKLLLLHGFDILKQHIMLIQQYHLHLIFFIKFNYLIRTNILQIVFDFNTYSTDP